MVSHDPKIEEVRSVKKTIKLMLTSLLVIALLFTLVGCGGEEATPTPDPNENGNGNEEALVPEEVLMDAAKRYFAHIKAGNNNITPPSEVKDMLDNNEDIFILDIRSAENFEAGHIPGSFHSDRGRVAENMERIPRDKPVIVTCYSGQNAGFVVAFLRMSGFDNVTSMLLGINLGWRGREELTLEGEGMVALAELPAVSEPKDDREEIIWNRAKAYGREIIAGKVGFLTNHQEIYDALQEDPESYYIIDIRRKEDFDKEHIQFSRHVAWGDMGQVLDTLPTDRPVVIACYSGQTAAQTMGVLRMIGFDNAANLVSGVTNGWIAQHNLPVVSNN